MKSLRSVLQFEYFTLVKSKVFIVVTLIMVILALVGPAIPAAMHWLDAADTGETAAETIALYDAVGSFTAERCRMYLPSYQFTPVTTREAALDAVSRGEAKYALVLEADNFDLYVTAMSLTQYTLRESISHMVQQEYVQLALAERGIPADEAERLLNWYPQSRIVAVDPPTGDNRAADNYRENIAYAYAMIFILYFGLVIHGQYILVSVVREKTTKTMELLITSCKAVWLINGKVLGVGLAGLTQLSLTVCAALLSMTVSGQWVAGAEHVFVVAVKPDIIVLMVVFFLLGFFSLAYVFAALASTVSRMEDANGVASLPMLAVIGGFLAAMSGMLTPGALWVTVVSYVPFVSPMVMFMRICLGSVAAWEIAVSIVWQLLIIVGISLFGAKIYRMGTLMYGKKLNMKDVVALFR